MNKHIHENSVYTDMYIYICIYYVFVYLFILICIYIYIYNIYICIYTHTRIGISKQDKCCPRPTSPRVEATKGTWTLRTTKLTTTSRKT